MERVLIIEDEQLAAEKLQMLIGRIDPLMRVEAVLTTVSEAVRWLSANTADLIFLDINLADDISFRIFEQVEVDAPIIFTTAYDQYAIRAFKQNSLDYVLKPVTEEDLRVSIAKYRKYRARDQDYGDKLKTLLTQYLPDQHFRSRILISYGGKSKSVAVGEVAYFYAFERGVYLKTFDDKTYLSDDTLDTLEAVLNPKVFHRLNRRYIVNIKAITEIHKYSTRRLKLDLNPSPPFDAIVPADKITSLKAWLNH